MNKAYVPPVGLGETNNAKIVSNLYHLTNFVNANIGSGGSNIYVNLSTFGVTFDNSTDDTAALNAAFASVAGTGATVVFDKPGFCKTTSTVSVGSPTLGVTSFTNIYSPFGFNNSGINYTGSGSGGPALLLQRVTFSTFTGFTVTQNMGSGSTGTVTGIVLGGQTGGFGNACHGLIFNNCAIFNFHVGVTDGNFGACSEIVFNSQVINSCDTGYTVNDFNSVDIVFIEPSVESCGVAFDSGAAEGFSVLGGSDSGASIAVFKAQQNGNVYARNFRSENSQLFVLGTGGGAILEGCSSLNANNQLSISGSVSLRAKTCLFSGAINLTSPAPGIRIEDCSVVPDKATGLPFTINPGQVSTSTLTGINVYSVNNIDINFPSTPVHDFFGILADSQQDTLSPFFVATGYYPTIYKNRALPENGASGPLPGFSTLGLDWQALSHVRSLSEGPIVGAGVQTIQTLVTNASTAAGSKVLHFASVPSTISYGMQVIDATGNNINGIVTQITSTTVTLSNNATGGGVANTSNINFYSPTGVPTPGQNLRIQGTFATSATLALPFTRSFNVNTGGGQNNIISTSTGPFFPSDVGKQLKIAGIGIGGWTDWYGCITTFVSSTQVAVVAMGPNVSPFAPFGGGGATATIGANEPDGNYMVLVTGNANETFWVTGIGSTGFTVHSSNATSTATVTALIVR